MMNTLAQIHELAKETDMYYRISKIEKSQEEALKLIRSFSEQLGLDYNKVTYDSSHWFEIEDTRFSVTVHYADQ